MNVGGEVTALGTITNNGAINITSVSAILTTPEAPTVNSTVKNYMATYADGAYKLAACVATIGDKGYTSLQGAINAVDEGQTIQLMEGTFEVGAAQFPASLKSVTIKGSENKGTILKNSTLSSSSGSSVSYENIVIDGIVFDNSRILFTGNRDGKVTYKNWTISNCEFKNIVADGNYAAVHFTLNSSKEAMDGFAFTNNVVNGVSGSNNSGVLINSVKGLVAITGNDIQNVAWNAVQLQNAPEDAKIVIEGNTLASGAAEGIVNLNKVAAKTSITGNRILAEEGQSGVGNISSADVSGNYWGGGAPAILPEGVTYANYYADAGLTKLIWVSAEGYVEKNGVEAVKKGTFAEDPSEHLAPGYYASKNADGTWTVKPIPYVPSDDEEDGCADDAACNVFGDVDEDAWYHEYVDWAHEKGILRGYNDGSGNVGPEDVTLRSHVMVMLHRMAGEPVAAADPGFNDVAEGAWYYEAVAWAKEVGLTTGYLDGSGDFGPSDVITREQMATVLYRFAVLNGCDVSAGEGADLSSYADADEISGFASEAMQWAVGAGIVSGYDDGSNCLGPQDDAERGHFAAMLMRLDAKYGIL